MTTMMKSNCPSTTYTNLLDLPDKYINFDRSLLVSCALANTDDLLRHCQFYINDLYQHRLSVHQFAEKWMPDGVSLWTANDVEQSELERRENVFAFYMVFKQQQAPENNGYVLVQCQLDRQERLQ